MLCEVLELTADERELLRLRVLRLSQRELQERLPFRDLVALEESLREKTARYQEARQAEEADQERLPSHTRKQRRPRRA